MPQAEHNPGDTMGEHIDQLGDAFGSAYAAFVRGQFDHGQWAESVLRVMRVAIEVSAIEPPGECLEAAIRAAASGDIADTDRLADEMLAWSGYLGSLRGSVEPTVPV